MTNSKERNERKMMYVLSSEMSEQDDFGNLKITEKNYYTRAVNAEWMSVSQFKDFHKCEAMALAKIKGEWEEEKGEALWLGSFVDEMLTGTKKSQNDFLDDYHDIVFQKSGKMREAFNKAMDAVAIVKTRQPYMMKLLSGEHQKIMTGEIEGVPFRIKMDSYKEGEFIADLKYMRSLRSPNLFDNIITYWGYDLQAAAYQEIVRQNTGKRLPFYFVVITKETPAHFEVGEISQDHMDEALAVIKANINRYDRIKRGELKPERCEDYGCNYCTETHIVKEAIDTDEFGLSAKQKKGMRGIG